MKPKSIFIILCLLATSLWAQSETLFNGGFESGGFGGPVIKFTQVNNQFGLLVGGRGGWIINHVVAIGGGGYGLTNVVNAPSSAGEELRIRMGYGGFEVTTILNSEKLIHFTVNALFGAGSCYYSKRGSDIEEYEQDGFFIVEPAFNLILNVAPLFRIGAGIGYRYVAGLEMTGLTGSDLSGFSGVLTFKFGHF